MCDIFNTKYGCHEYFKDSAYKRFHRFHQQEDSYLLFNYNLGGNSCCCDNYCGGGLFGGGFNGILGLLGGGLIVGGLFGLGKALFAGKAGGGDKDGKTDKPEKDNTDIGSQGKGIADLQAKVKKQAEEIEALKAENAQQDGTIGDLTTRLTALENAGNVKPSTVPTDETEADFAKKLESDNIDDIIALLNNKDLTDDQIEQVISKFKDLLTDLQDDKKLELAKNKDLDPRLLALVRGSYYLDDANGNKYQNVAKTELTSTAAATLEVIRAHDTGGTRDVEQASGRDKSTITINGQTIEIEIHDKFNGSDLNAGYEFVREEGGELIFKSKKAGSNQEYVLQKDFDGKLHLIQYEYHTGYGNADYTK